MSVEKNRQQRTVKQNQNMEAEELHKDSKVNSQVLNVRQVFNKVRGPARRYEATTPNRCVQEWPDNINVYTDGSLYAAKVHWVAYGGAAARWPGRTGRTPCAAPPALTDRNGLHTAPSPPCSEVQTPRRESQHGKPRGARPRGLGDRSISHGARRHRLRDVQRTHRHTA